MCTFNVGELPIHPSKWKSERKKLNLLIVGKTGNGLSATANTILGLHLFDTSLNVSSTTTEISSHQIRIQDYNITVIDTPGAAAAAATTEMNYLLKANTKYAELLERCFQSNEIHAFILVIKFGVRFTEEEIYCVSLLKHIFGRDLIKRYCVLVMTYGDQFVEKHKTITFEKWCSMQEGFFNKLYDECNHRVVLFDNSCWYKRHEQVGALLTNVEKLETLNDPYTYQQLEAAKMSNRVIVLDINEELCQITNDLQLLRERIDGDKTSEYSCLINRLENVLHTISHGDIGNDVISRALELMDNLLNAFSGSSYA
ncbi:Immune-associated nucleotide-binding protein 13 [Bulinus truncatus]|nr:Immune-associated nucleotide-binding protein 13 [Bulinus truncatus]